MSPLYRHRDLGYEPISAPSGDSEFLYVVRTEPCEDMVYDSQGNMAYNKDGRPMWKKGVNFTVECVPIDWDEDPDEVLNPKDDIPYRERRFVSTRALSPKQLGDAWGVPVRKMKVGEICEAGDFTITRIQNRKPGFGILRRC